MNYCFYILIAFTFLSENSSVVTIQKPELIVNGSDTLFIHVEYQDDSPLSKLYSLRKYEKKLLSQKDTTCWSSGCNRDYAPTWLIKDNEFFLNKMNHCCSEKTIKLNEIFKRKKLTNEGVKAFWVNEKITATNHFLDIYYSFNTAEYGKIKWYEIDVQNGLIKSIKEKS